MVPERWRQIEQLFHSALEVPSSDRDRLLAAADAEPQLRADVARLLSEHDSAGDFLSLAVRPVGEGCDALRAGLKIGAFRLTRMIGAGGMGVVYEAEQEHPRRTVAVKVLRGGFATPAALRRFHEEAETLGRLRHPAIAQIYEASTHNEGLLSIPYFAMEFVPGAMTILDYAAARSLNDHQRLELFARVGDAVHYGHQQAVIHRDLKPENILIDQFGEPKIIDFGVARTLNETPVSTAITDTGHLIGTLPYMSPEQIRGDAGEIDVRTDVFSLGVVLFELLSGKRPRDMGSEGIAAAIRSLEIATPISLDRIDGRYRGDLATIVGKALQPEKRQRYASTSEFVADIRRYLRNEPVEARSPGVFYKFRKFAQRNRALTAAGALAIGSVLTGLFVSVRQTILADAERGRAAFNALRAERISTFLQRVFDAADPKLANGDVTVRAALDRAAAGIEADLAADPRAAADVHEAIGRIYERLGDAGSAVRHLRAALVHREKTDGPDSLETARALTSLAWSADCGDPDEPEALFSRAHSIYRQQLGDEHELTIAAQIYRASAMNRRGKYAEAEGLLRQAVASLRALKRETSADGAFAVKHLGVSLEGRQKYEQAETCFVEALRIQRALPQPDAVELGITLRNYAKLLRKMNRLTDAEAAEREAELLLTPTGNLRANPLVQVK